MSNYRLVTSRNTANNVERSFKWFLYYIRKPFIHPERTSLIGLAGINFEAFAGLPDAGRSLYLAGLAYCIRPAFLSNVPTRDIIFDEDVVGDELVEGKNDVSFGGNKKGSFLSTSYKQTMRGGMNGMLNRKLFEMVQLINYVHLF